MPRTIALNWIDWVTLAIVLVSILRGARFGAVAGLVDLAGLVATYLAAAAVYPIGAQYLQQVPVLTVSWQRFIAFVVIWLGLYLPFGLVIRWVFARAKFPASGLVGGVFGIARGIVLAASLLVLTLAAPFRGVVAADAHRSQVAPYLLSGSERVQAVLLPALPVHIQRLGPGGATF
ncbi:MAG TPA: CvpA family protein [bacterium]|nr:CvpA family protein [bacterium]